ncbi:MAG: DUF5126 domain-containing protein [Cytophagales bacterium]|nr:DUF5126 domain-containing protein [Cytophagales bacterium]
MKRIFNYVQIFSITLISALVVGSCVEPYLGLEQIQTDTTPPGKITVKEVVPKPGALEIHFEPAKGDADIAQIKAYYLNKAGETVDFMVSRYSSSILVEGLTGTKQVDIEVVAIDNSGNISEVTLVKGTPLLSPVEYARQSLRVSTAFGGVKVDWENKNGDLLVFHVLTEDTLQIKGDTTFIEDPSKRIYTRDTTSRGTVAYIRHYPDKEQKFGFVISDKWGNRTDTLVSYITPLKEDPIDSKKIEVLNWFNWKYTQGQSKDYDLEGYNPETGIQNDGLFYSGFYGPQTLFDGSGAAAFYCTKFTKNLGRPDAELLHPAYITYDLNIDVRLSRMVVNWRNNLAYSHNSLKRFRFWGTDDENTDRVNKFPEGWKLIGEYVAPDAIDNANPTQDELNAWTAGIQFSIEDDNVNPDADPTATFRYLRIEMLDVYGDKEAYNAYTVNEIHLYGLMID